MQKRIYPMMRMTSLIWMRVLKIQKRAYHLQKMKLLLKLRSKNCHRSKIRNHQRLASSSLQLLHSQCHQNLLHQKVPTI